jgi:hypothetical protein
VAVRLSFIADLVRPTVVDLGCGAGLGCSESVRRVPRCRLSSYMAREAAADEASVTVGLMDDLNFSSVRQRRCGSCTVRLVWTISVRSAAGHQRAQPDTTPVGLHIRVGPEPASAEPASGHVAGQGWYRTRGISGAVPRRRRTLSI